MDMTSFSYTLGMKDVPITPYDEWTVNWLADHNEQAIRDAVKDGYITITQFEKITGLDY
jgi:hypothetical protein